MGSCRARSDRGKPGSNNTRERHRVISDDNASLHHAIRTATKFMIDAELEDWVEEQNVQKGISPAPGVMISRANEIKHNLVC